MPDAPRASSLRRMDIEAIERNQFPFGETVSRRDPRDLVVQARRDTRA